MVLLADVKALAGAGGPCITLAMPIPKPAELADRLKSALRSIQKQLVERHTDTKTAGRRAARADRATGGQPGDSPYMGQFADRIPVARRLPALLDA